LWWTAGGRSTTSAVRTSRWGWPAQLSVPAGAGRAAGVLPLWLPAELLLVPSPRPPADPEPVALISADEPPAPACPDVVEVDRVVPPREPVAGRAAVLVRSAAGRATGHAVAGHHDGAPEHRRAASQDAAVPAEHDRPGSAAHGRRPAGRTAAGPARRGCSPPARSWRFDRTVNPSGLVHIAARRLQVGSPLAGRRVTVRLEPQLAHVVVDGVLWRTAPFTLTANDRARLQGARLAGPPPAPPVGPTQVQRRASCRSQIHVISQPVQVGFPPPGRPSPWRSTRLCYGSST